MKPSSVSATSLTTARQCLARYKAENIDYARSWSNPAAMLGTSIHSALEQYVDECYIQHKYAPSESQLEALFEMHFIKLFGADASEELHDAGITMVNDWSARESSHMAGRKILTLEIKEFILIETPMGNLKLNYILDRFDEIGPDEYEIIDYKSSYFNETIHTMLKLLQPKIYAIAMFIKYPNAKKMLVTYDMLRYKPVTIEVTREEARTAFAEIYEIIQTILDTPDDNPPETLNKACNYCIRKASCVTLQKNIDAGGLFSLDLQGQIDLRTELELKIKGLKTLHDELEDVIEESMGSELMEELSTGSSRAYFTVPTQNKISSIDEVRRTVGDEIFFRYGTTGMTLKAFDKLCKDSTLTDEQRVYLKELKTKEFKDPKLNFENLRSEGKTAAVTGDYAGKLAPAKPAAPIVGLED